MDVLASTILYFAVYSLSAALFSLSIKIRYRKNICFVIALLIPVVFAGIRYGIGTDYFVYMGMYQRLSVMSLRSLLASDNSFFYIIIFLFAKIARFLGGWKFFYGLYALSAYLPFMLLIRKRYQNVPVFLVTFLYLTGMFTTGFNIMRQATAAVIVFCSFQYIYEKDFKKFALFIFLAALFHTSAAVILVVYPLYGSIKVNKKKWSMALLAVPLLLVVVFYKQIIMFLSRFPLFENYLVYAEEGGTGNNRVFFLHLLIVLGLWCFKKPLTEYDERNDLLFMLIFIGVVLDVIGFQAVFVRRIASYFYNFPSYFLIAQLPMILKKKDYGISCTLVYLYGVAIFVAFYAVLNQSGILPYRILEG